MDELENTVLEAILDTRGTKTIVSQDLAWDLNWEVDTPTKGKTFGSYLRPGGKPNKNSSLVPRPIGIRFSPDIIINIQKIKVIEHSDLIFLIGADILCRGSGSQNTCFKSIWSLGTGHGKIDFTVGLLTKTAELHWPPFRKGHQDLDLEPWLHLKKWFQKKALS